VLRIWLPLAWFVTMVGGWSDLGKVAAEELSSFGQSRIRGARTMLTGVTLLEGDVFAVPTFVTVADSELLFIDRYRHETVLAVDRHSGRLVGSFGRHGEGPGEFESPRSLVVEGDRVAVLDPGVNRITWLARDASTSGFRLLGVAGIRATSIPTGFAGMPDSGFLVSGFLGNHRMARLDRSGELLDAVGREVPDSLPPAIVGEVVQGKLRASPHRDRFLLTSRFASHIEIIDASTMTDKTIWGPERFQPHAGKYETRFGYLDSAPMKDGFLALYSGRTRAEFPGRANYGSTIHEFGWEGQLRAVYELDSDVISIAWSEADRLLYAVRHDPVPGVVVYALN
jgi:hypothetical protein